MDPPGILMLNSVRRVFELAEIKPESILYQKEQFDSSNIIDALTNEKKCPVITTADFTDYFKDGTTPPFNKHVMVTAGALKGSDFMPQNGVLANEWFIQCKNSYGKDPNQPGIIQYRIKIYYIAYEDAAIETRLQLRALFEFYYLF